MQPSSMRLFEQRCCVAGAGALGDTTGRAALAARLGELKVSALRKRAAAAGVAAGLGRAKIVSPPEQGCRIP